MRRRLDPEEAALWERVTATVRPLDRRLSTPPPPFTTPPAPPPAHTGARAASAPQRRAMPPAAQTNTLDGGWDRRLASGRIEPDVTLDLHGHNLASAHALLERRLGEAIAHGHRVMLVITGKPPRAEQDRERPRGLIRQNMPDWIAASPYRSAIAAVRGAHPRHGGQGALYLILRRRRETAP